MKKSVSVWVVVIFVLSGARAMAAEFLCTSSTTIPNYGPTDLLGAIRGSIDPNGSITLNHQTIQVNWSQKQTYGNFISVDQKTKISISPIPATFPSALPKGEFEVSLESTDLDCGDCDRGCCYVSGWASAGFSCEMTH